MVRRDRHDIVVDVLKEATSGRKKTELMSNVGLSYQQMKRYLGILIAKGLLEIDEHHRLKTTRKGTAFLEKCSECLLFPWERQKRKT